MNWLRNYLATPRFRGQSKAKYRLVQNKVNCATTIHFNSDMPKKVEYSEQLIAIFSYFAYSDYWSSSGTAFANNYRRHIGSRILIYLIDNAL
jgi:hypothetical protein